MYWAWTQRYSNIHDGDYERELAPTTERPAANGITQTSRLSLSAGDRKFLPPLFVPKEQTAVPNEWSSYERCSEPEKPAPGKFNEYRDRSASAEQSAT
jgi:hypothetical protein